MSTTKFSKDNKIALAQLMQEQYYSSAVAVFQKFTSSKDTKMQKELFYYLITMYMKKHHGESR